MERIRITSDRRTDVDIDLTVDHFNYDVKLENRRLKLPREFSSVYLQDKDGFYYVLRGETDELVAAIAAAGYKLASQGSNVQFWESFAAAGLFWWVNRSLIIFGWSLEYEVSKSGRIARVYPVRRGFRGIEPEHEDQGFKALTTFMKNNVETLYSEVLTVEVRRRDSQAS